jgi:putative phosphoribosyl transferase
MNLTREDHKERLFPVTSNSVSLEADVVIPPKVEKVVFLVYSTRGKRHSVSSHLFAEKLRQSGFATVAIALLTLHEEASDWHTKYLLFNANLLAERLGDATDWLIQQPLLKDLKRSYCGMGIEAGAVLLAAAEKPSRVEAIACINGRADFALAVLPQITMPTLLVVGEEDSLSQRINQKALGKIQSEKRLEQIPGATHLNEQPEVLEAIANLTAQWFEQHLHQKLAIN